MKKLVEVMILTLTAMMVIAGASAIKADAAGTTTTKITTKTSTQVTRLAKAAKSGTSKKTSTKVSTKKSVQGQYAITAKTTVKTTITTKIAATKKTVTTQVQTIVATTKEVKSTVTSNTASNVSNTSAGLNIQSVDGKVSANVIKAFETLGYKIVMKYDVKYSGYFNARNRVIELRRAEESVLYHELGHFVAFIAGSKDQSAEFKSIYKNEVAKYVGPNKAYVTQNESEYFAESYRNMIENGAKLQAERPATYNFLVKCVNSIDDNSVAMIQAIYY